MADEGAAEPERRPSFKDPSALAEILVRASLRRPWLVIVLSLVAAAAGAYVSATRFAITTQTDQLLQVEAGWVDDKHAFETAFPQLSAGILVVVDGETPEIASGAAQKLTAALEASPAGIIKSVSRPDGGPFFEREGLLLLPLGQVKTTTDQLVQQQPMLSALAADPTLRGLLKLVQLGTSQGELGDSAKLLGDLSGTIEKVLRGEPARLSWQTAMTGKTPEPRELRRFILVEPVFDFAALEPAAKATTRIRLLAASLGLTPDEGVTIRLTGPAPLADEEFATIREGTPMHLGLTVIAIAIILWLALKSGRVIFAVLLTTFIGLVVTIGTGLLMVGRFNVISVAVAALFLGLGVDFGIQVAVRYRDERFRLDDVKGAIRRAGRAVGWSLTLAALSLLAGFFAFLPTSFKGVSELGLITGVGMIIAFVASLTTLPALIAVTRPKGERETVEMPWLAGVDHWILRHRKLVIGVSTLLVLAGLPFLLKLQFDANPMHLRSDKTEAVATFVDLTRTAGMTPNTISVMAPSLEAAKPLAERLARLPEVSDVVSLATFLPDDQDRKLKLIRAAAEELADFLDAQPPAPAPTDAELVTALRRTATTLTEKAKGPAADAQLRLAQDLTKLADAAASRREAADMALTGDLPAMIEKLRLLLKPDPITLASLPAGLKADWLAKDGRARIEVVPKGDANDNAVLERFVDAVRAVAPHISGAPVEIVETSHAIVQAFVTAGVLALIAVFLILTLALRRPVDVALTLGPLVIATIITLEVAYLIGMPLNLANIIALPLMLAVGVNFHIYYMIAWRNGVSDMLASSLTRAIFFSSLTTGVAFGSLWLSNHPGTASMGKLLTLSLLFTLLAAFIIVPAFLGPPREEARRKAEAEAAAARPA